MITIAFLCSSLSYATLLVQLSIWTDNVPDGICILIDNYLFLRKSNDPYNIVLEYYVKDLEFFIINVQRLKSICKICIQHLEMCWFI